MLGLISTPDPRYGGTLDPDEERKRRWEPLSRHISLPMCGSLLCLIVSRATSLAAGIALTVAAVVLCVYAMRAAWPSSLTPRSRRRRTHRAGPTRGRSA